MIELCTHSIRELYKLDNITRYNTLNKIKQESVASHSFYVTLFSMMLCDDLGLSDTIKLKAMQVALTHDIPEIVINDVTHDAKARMPEIVPILKQYEDTFLMCTFEHVYDIIKSYKDDDIIARMIVDLADVISVYQYCDNEIMMGNGYFDEMIEASKKRIKKEEEKIGRRINKCPKIMI